MKPPRLFAEIPAGLASVSLALQGGKHCKPPVSRMGNKAGYASVILDAMGLRPGLGAESYLWTEADPDVRALLCAYTQPELLRAVAEVLRGWKDEEPRALWTRLRDERRARAARLPPAEAVAEWMFLHHGSFSGKDIEGGMGRPQGGVIRATNGDDWRVRPSRDIVEDAALRLATGPGWPPVAVTAAPPSVEDVAGWLAFLARSGMSGGYKSPEHGPGNLENPEELPRRVGRLAALPWPPTCITSRAPTAEEVAGWVAEFAGTHPGGGGFRGLHCNRPSVDGFIPSREALAEAVDALASVSSHAGGPTSGADLEGCVVYMDPDYQGTTGYNATMPRAEVVRLATSYAAAGALVVVSEAVAIPELTALGWEAISIAGERRGQKRTFSKEQGEWITMSRPPVNRPAVAQPLFALGAA